LSLFFIFSNNSKINLNALSTYLKTVNNGILSQDEKPIQIEPLKSDLVINGPLMHIEVEKTILEDTKNSQEDTPANILVDIPILDGDDNSPTIVSGKGKKRIHIDIIKTTNITAYKDVERRFKQSHDIDDSLFLARSYYKKGNYKKSEYWALQTNKVNPNIEESMLIFVKSKMKLGRKNEARNIIRKYVRSSNSQEAKKLLYKIENDKF